MRGNLTHHFSSNLLCTLLQWDPERSWPSLQQAWKPRRLHLSKQQGWEWHRYGWSIFFLRPSTDSHRRFSSAAAFQCQTRVTSGFQQAHNGLTKTLSKACTSQTLQHTYFILLTDISVLAAFKAAWTPSPIPALSRQAIPDPNPTPKAYYATVHSSTSLEDCRGGINCYNTAVTEETETPRVVLTQQQGHTPAWHRSTPHTARGFLCASLYGCGPLKTENGHENTIYKQSNSLMMKFSL